MPLKTSEEQAFERLKELIIDGEIPSGEFLSQRMLAGRVDVSVVTVRSSLRRLENEGLIESVPKWGVRIPEETEERIRDRYFVRELLEVGAVERILDDRSNKVRRKLEALAKDCDEVSGSSPEDIKEFATKHMKFHLGIAEGAGSEILLAMLKRLNMSSLMLWNAKRGWARNKGRYLGVHCKLIENIYELEFASALEVVRVHVRDGMENELEALENE